MLNLFKPKWRIKQWRSDRTGNIWWAVYRREWFLFFPMWDYLDMFQDIENAKQCVEQDKAKRLFKPEVIIID